MFEQLNLISNDLAFVYLPPVVRAAQPTFCELRAVIDVSHFYAQGAHHAIFAMDCAGGQGSNNPHCGPIIRDGKNLFATARGVIILHDGTVLAETWNGTASPELVPFVNQVPEVFDPKAHACLNVRVRGHYAGGMSVQVRSGLVGPVLFQSDVSTAAWPWLGSMQAAIGGIAVGFVPPADTGCVEEILPRSAPDARLGVAAFARVA